MDYQFDGIRHVEIQNKSHKEKKDMTLEDSFDDSILNFKARVEECEDMTLKEGKNRKSGTENLLTADSDNIKLDSLLKAVIDITDRLQEQEEKLNDYEKKINDDEKYTLAHLNEWKKRSTRPRTAVMKYTKDNSDDSNSDQESYHSSSKQSTVTVSSSRSKQRHNNDNNRLSMSFTDEKVRTIDMENQRLLKEILKTKTKPSQSKRQHHSARIKSASGINRTRRQQEIDQENMRLLRRLQAVKPTGALSRDQLLKDHMRNEKTSSQLSKVKSRPTSAPISRNIRPKSGRSWFENDSVASSQLSLRSGSSKSSRASSAHRKNTKRVTVQEVWEPGW